LTSPSQRRRLIAAAEAARKNAYCPFSGYPVGAALLMRSGKIYAGCNVESPTLILQACAERGAIFAAVAAGERKIAAVCTVSAASLPCGACRQALFEFGGPDTEVISVLAESGETVTTTLARLLPQAHTDEQIKGRRRRS